MRSEERRPRPRRLSKTEMQVEQAKWNRESFSFGVRFPIGWYLCAMELGKAAYVLIKHMDAMEADPLRVRLGGEPYFSLAPVYLLYGLAVENLLKGLLVAKSVATPIRGKLNPTLRTHDLPRLFVLAGLKAAPHENRLLRKLQWYVQSGKYPVAIKPSSYRPHPEAADPPRIVRLLKRVMTTYRRLSDDERYRHDQTLELLFHREEIFGADGVHDGAGAGDRAASASTCGAGR